MIPNRAIWSMVFEVERDCSKVAYVPGVLNGRSFGK